MVCFFADEKLGELVGSSQIFSTLLPMVVAYISPVAAIDPRVSYNSTLPTSHGMSLEVRWAIIEVFNIHISGFSAGAESGAGDLASDWPVELPVRNAAGASGVDVHSGAA